MKSINNPSCHILKIIQQARKNELYKELVDGDAKKVKEFEALCKKKQDNRSVA